MTNPDIVVVGGGPVGLWIAIQTKLRTGKEVHVLEKYHEYKRKHIRLRIEKASLKGIPKHEPLQKCAASWANKTVPITEIENRLVAIASDLGITILKGKEADPKKMQQEYPDAKVFIGADGARSSVRKEIFGDKYAFNFPHQYLVQVQYRVKHPRDEKSTSDPIIKIAETSIKYRKLKFAGHFIEEKHKTFENGETQVTLRIFIDEETYKQMADAKYSNPYYFEDDLNNKIPEKLRTILIKWWGASHEHDIVVNDKKTNKITVIPLASYAAKEVVKEMKSENDQNHPVVFTLVGDAAQAYPFFRAINNGFLNGTKLSKTIEKAFEANVKARQNNIKGDANRTFFREFHSYSRYSKKRSWLELTRASVKNCFLNLSKFWLRFSSHFPWKSGKFSRADQQSYYNEGVHIWENITGEIPPEMRIPKSDWKKRTASDLDCYPMLSI